MSRWDVARRAAWAKYGERHSRSIVRGDFIAALWPLWLLAGLVVAGVWVSNQDVDVTVSWFVTHWPVTLTLAVVGVILWRRFTRKPWE